MHFLPAFEERSIPLVRQWARQHISEDLPEYDDAVCSSSQSRSCYVHRSYESSCDVWPLLPSGQHVHTVSDMPDGVDTDLLIGFAERKYVGRSGLRDNSGLGEVERSCAERFYTFSVECGESL